MAQPRNRGWIVSVLNKARSRGNLPVAAWLPQVSYDELKANMGGTVAFPPGRPENTVFGTTIGVDPSLQPNTVRVECGYSLLPAQPSEVP